MLRTKLLLLLTIILVAAPLSAYATVQVTNLQMVKSGQFTELSIACSDKCDFTHQIVEQAANKPYRIVVDIKDAIHGLPQHAFANLPGATIKQIRTSQFSTEPEKIVRIVVDAVATVTYKVKAGDNGVTLMINTPNDQDFVAWSAVPGAAPVVASSQPAAPKPMPAIEGNEANAPKVDKGDPARQNLQLAGKPIDEGKLLNKKPTNSSTNQTPPTAGTPTPQPTVTGDPALLETIYGASQPESKTAAPAAVNQPATAQPKSEPAKVVDSAVIPQLRAPGTQPAATPSESIKPPTSQKTALPDVKVNPKPKFAENEPPAAGTVGTALSNTKTDTATEVAQDDASAAVKSKSDAVREKYQAQRDRNAGDEPATDTPELAQDNDTPASLSKIDRIRLKYKRGIKFVQNEADEQRQAEDLMEVPVEEYAEAPQVGPYNEFLPEREIVVYNTGGRLDPFEPLIEDAQKSAGYDRIPDVESLRLVGVLLDKRSSRALFEDANGYSYILQTGDRVKNGFVLSITEERVVFQIRQYGWNRQVALDLEDSQ